MQKNYEPGTAYSCSCGEEYMNEEFLKQHQQNTCKNRLNFSCSFCQESLSSANDLRSHLLLCGNKTDECPKCRRLIRRSHFAYHYENNCASIDNLETPPTERQNRPKQPSPINPNKPISRVDIPNGDYRENFLMSPQRINDKNQSNLRILPVIIQCEFCGRSLAKNDYETHRNNCNGNPANVNRKRSPQIPLKPNQNASNGIVHIPCEICNQSVDLPNWSNHVQLCREREAHRLKNRARSMSQEPIVDELPCEYCQQSFSATQLRSHERNCLNNPGNVKSGAKHARERPKPSLALPMKPKHHRSSSMPANDRTPNGRDVHYQQIDLDRTHAANRSPANGTPNNLAGAKQQYIRRTPSDQSLKLRNSPRGGHIRDNTPMQPNPHLYENISPSPDQRGPSNGSPQRGKPLYIDNPEHRHRLRPGSERLEVIDNQADTPLIRKHRPSWLKRFFGCASEGVYD